MHNRNAAAMVLFALLMLPQSSIAQSSLLKRINKVKDVSIWQRKPLAGRCKSLFPLKWDAEISISWML